MLNFLIALTNTEHEVVNQLPLPPVVFGVIAMTVFVAVTLVFYSFRDVANRHSQKAEQFAREHEGDSH